MSRMSYLDLEAGWKALTCTDDLLGDILIRLPTLADLGRASAAYAAFRRVITSLAFLRRRLHTLHPPSLLGFRTFTGRFRPVDPPHPSAHAGRALAGAADFRFSFLPDAGFWVVRDSRDGRFLLDRVERGDGTFATIAVCDPLFRRYVLLPEIPKDLAATVQEEPHIRVGTEGDERRCEIFLAPSGEEAAVDADQTQPFRVIWMAQCPSRIVAFIFSSSSGQWGAITSPRWHDLYPTVYSMIRGEFLSCRNYACGCFYWLHRSIVPYDWVVLDMDTMEFNPLSPPSDPRNVNEFAMVELGDSRCGMFVLTTNGDCSPKLQLFYANRQNHGASASEWLLENEVSLSGSWSNYHILGASDGKLILQTRDSSSDSIFGCISLDFKTLQRQKIRDSCWWSQFASHAIPIY